MNPHPNVSKSFHPSQKPLNLLQSPCLYTSFLTPPTSPNDDLSKFRYHIPQIPQFETPQTIKRGSSPEETPSSILKRSSPNSVKTFKNGKIEFLTYFDRISLKSLKNSIVTVVNLNV